MQAVLEQNLITTPAATQQPDNTKNKIGFFGSVFGCWHPRLTRPMSDRQSTYQACVECGARRQVDTQNFKAFGPFYYPVNAGTENGLSV